CNTLGVTDLVIRIESELRTLKVVDGGLALRQCRRGLVAETLGTSILVDEYLGHFPHTIPIVRVVKPEFQSGVLGHVDDFKEKPIVFFDSPTVTLSEDYNEVDITVRAVVTSGA